MNKKKWKLLEKRKATAQEKERYEKILDAEKEKFSRDLLAGGVSENGQYVRLHDRYI